MAMRQMTIWGEDAHVGPVDPRQARPRGKRRQGGGKHARAQLTLPAVAAPVATRTWESWEDEVLRAKWGQGRGPSVAEELGRTYYSCLQRARRIGVSDKRPRVAEWLQDEDGLIREHYGAMALPALRRRVNKHGNKRTEAQIRARARQLGVAHRKRPWMPADDRDLLELLGRMTAQRAARKLGRRVEDVRIRVRQLTGEGCRAQSECLTASNLAKLLGVASATAQRWCQAGLLPARKDGGHWWIDKKAARDFVRAYPGEVKIRQSEQPMDLTLFLLGVW
jgi:hypothetical protein